MSQPMRSSKFTDGKGRIELVDLNGNAVGAEPRAGLAVVAERKLAGTDSCQVEHIGYVLQGSHGAENGRWTERQFGPGDAFHMPPGHDAWIVGGETCVLLDFEG